MGTTQVTTTVVTMFWYHWVFYVIIAAVGALASSLVVNKGKFVIPQLRNVLKKDEGNTQTLTQKTQDMGFTGDVIVGVAAALAVWWAITPQTLFQVIGIAAVAGYGGSTILQSLVNKLNAATSGEKQETSNLVNSLLLKEKEQKKAEQEELNELSLNAFLTDILGAWVTTIFPGNEPSCSLV